MASPYYWPFPQRQDTMFMSTICTWAPYTEKQSSSLKKPARDSSFQIKDIEGAQCKQQIPKNVQRENYIYSTYVEPRPEFAKSVTKVSDPLRHRDIEGSYPQAVEFKTSRVVNPLAPRYKLPSSDPVQSTFIHRSISNLLQNFSETP